MGLLIHPTGGACMECGATRALQWRLRFTLCNSCELRKKVVVLPPKDLVAMETVSNMIVTINRHIQTGSPENSKVLIRQTKKFLKKAKVSPYDKTRLQRALKRIQAAGGQEHVPNFRLGECVWAKYGNWPWFPAQVMETFDNGTLQVRFFGTGAEAVLPSACVAIHQTGTSAPKDGIAVKGALLQDAIQEMFVKHLQNGFLEGEKCMKCNSPHETPESRFLLCEEGDHGMHMRCAGLEKFPEGPWFCVDHSSQTLKNF